MAVSDTYVFPGFITPVLTHLFFPKPQTTFLTCFCRGERRKYAGKKSRHNQGSNTQPTGHESDTLTTEPPERLTELKNIYIIEIYMKKQYNSSIIKNHKITNKKFFDGIPLKDYVASQVIFRFRAGNKNKHCGNIQLLMTL